MSKTLKYARASALPAIAAVLALSSTPLLAQQAQPVPTDTSPPASTAAPAPDAAPAASEPATPAPAATDSTPAADTSTATTAPARTVRAHKQVTRGAAAKPVKSTVRTSTRTTATHVAAPVAATAPAARTPPPPAASPTPTTQSAVKPVVDMTAKSPPATSAAAAPAKHHDDTLPIAAGGILALLAIGGGAAALARRKREEEWVEDEPMAYEPVESASAEEPTAPAVVDDEQPAIVAPSAFAWGNAENPRATAPAARGNDERNPGETWVERAYRGPSPSNPSVSLKTRLRRAAFFDKRERDAAAGLAEPLDPSAGLPRSMIREQETELA